MSVGPTCIWRRRRWRRADVNCVIFSARRELDSATYVRMQMYAQRVYKFECILLQHQPAASSCRHAGKAPHFYVTIYANCGRVGNARECVSTRRTLLSDGICAYRTLTNTHTLMSACPNNIITHSSSFERIQKVCISRVQMIIVCRGRGRHHNQRLSAF